MSSQTMSSRRQRSFRVEAVIMRHKDWGEADRMVWLYTRGKGKVSAIAKGVRKPRSRKAGHLEPFMRSNLQLARGREIPIVTQAETVDAYLPLREDMVRATYASYVVELLDRFTYEEDENNALYRLLVSTLERLCSSFDLDLVVRYYEMRLLDYLGFRPQLFHCLVCGAEIQAQDQYFSAHRGGALCPKCGSREPGSRPISISALKYLRHFQRSNFAKAMRASPAQTVNREMEILMYHYLTYLLERGLNTPPFLRRIRKDAGGSGDTELTETEV